MSFFNNQTGGPRSPCPTRGLVIALVLHGFLLPGTFPTVRAQEPTVLKGHEASVSCALFSPDGKTLVTAGGDGIFKVWDPATGKAVTEVDAHEWWLPSMAFSPDGALLATGCATRKTRDFTVKLWDTKTWKELPPVEGGHPGYIQGVAFLAGGKLLAAGSGSAGLLRVWDVETRKLRYSQKFPASIRALDVSPDGKVLAMIYIGGEVRLWDVAAEKETARWQVSGVRGYGVRWAPDGKALATAGAQVDELWTPAGTALETWKPEEGRNVSSPLAFSPDGRFLAAVASGRGENVVYLLDGQTLRERLSFHPHRRGIHALAFSPDGKRLVTGGDDKLVKIWDVAKLLEAATKK